MSDPPDAAADFLLALADGPLPACTVRRIAWPDFWIPTDRADAVEVACHGGRGRTGTALAALAVLDGMPANRAVRWVRRNYDPKAVETPWQAWWVRTVPRPRPA